MHFRNKSGHCSPVRLQGLCFGSMSLRDLATTFVNGNQLMVLSMVREHTGKLSNCQLYVQATAEVSYSSNKYCVLDWKTRDSLLLYTNISALKSELVMVVGFQSATRCSGQGRFLQSQFTCLQLIKIIGIIAPSKL